MCLTHAFALLSLAIATSGARRRVIREKKRSIDDLDAFAYKPTENA